ncbi:hypothetical protein JG687_00019056 [Phytophthora cactorum]|uniref:Uncharacterized protein n=1 Tax=Phytophthora cactorum TaxID=29920 RepID=A0A8T1TMT4_9STRA|nr:hypothetical protein GQ600_20681 [Phytophthora cactorum]KAG6942449.1 hypothetical protein JG687_00019056 [Phytophthora cactorum]
MEDSVEQANALIQRKLVLVKDSALAHKTIECSFNVTDDLCSDVEVDYNCADSTEEKGSTSRHDCIPEELPGKAITMHRESLPNEHDPGKMGVAITKRGTVTENDLITMKPWQEGIPKWKQSVMSRPGFR